MAKQRFSPAEVEWARRYQQNPATAGPPPSSAPTGSAQQVDPVMQTYRQQGIIPPAMIDRQAPAKPDPLRGQLLGAMTGVSALPKAIDTAFGGRAMRGVAAGNPREALSLIPGSDQFGLTDPRQEAASHFGFVGDTLLNPDMAKFGLQLGKAGATGLAGMLGSRGMVPGAVPGVAAQFVPRPAVGRSPFGTFIERTTPGAAPRLRPKGGLPVVKPPQPGVPASLPAPPRQAQLEDLDPVKAYDRLTAGWRDPLAATVPRSVADPGRAVAQGARASKEFGKISAASNRVPDRPVPTYQPPPEALAAHADPSRTVGTEQAAQNIARRSNTDMAYANVNSPGNLAYRAAANIGGLAQKGGSYLMNALRGQGGSVPSDKAAIGFIRAPRPSLSGIPGVPEPADLVAQLRGVMQHGMNSQAPPMSSASEFNSVADLMRNGTRMYKQNPAGDIRGVGGTPTMKSPSVDSYGKKSVSEALEANPEWYGFARPGSAMRPGIAGVAAPKPGASPSQFGKTVRHERSHSIMQEASRRGNVATSRLPAVMKIPVQMQNSDNPVLKGLGHGFDEATARAMEARGPIMQGVEGSKFLFNDTPVRRYYGDQVFGISPTAGHLFNAIPKLASGSGTAAAIAPAALLHAIRNGSETNGGY